jgi:hypothetical protein
VSIDSAAPGSPESPLNRCGGRKLSGCAANQDDCSKCGRVVCSFCGITVIPRVGSYWFLLLSPRGRCRMPGVEELRTVLCGPCGRRARELLESAGFDPVMISRAMTGGPE